MAGKEQYTAQQMIDAIRATKGQLTLAARQVGCTYRTIRRYVERYPTVQEALDEETERMGDAVELALYDEAVNKRNITALIFLAKTKFHQRGYTQRVNHDITSGGQPIVQWVSPISEDDDIGIGEDDLNDADPDETA